jgi:hypothetical protein
VALVVGIVLSYALDLAAHGVAVVGHVSTGLPVPGIPNIHCHAFQRAMGTPSDYDGLRAEFFGATRRPAPAPTSPRTLDTVLREFSTRVAPHTVSAYHPRSFGYFTPPPLVASVAGEVLAQVAQQGIDGSVSHLDFDHCFEGWTGPASIRDEHFSLQLTSSLRYLVVYTPHDKEYFCVEPVSHVSDAIHMADPADHGLLTLQPGQTTEAWMKIDVASL